MLRHIKGVLSAEEIRQIFAIMAEGKFEDGAATASGRAREVKNNLQFERRPETKKKLDQLDLFSSSGGSIIDAILALEMDTMKPEEALARLIELKNRVRL